MDAYHQAIRAVRGEGATVQRTHRQPSQRVDDTEPWPYAWLAMEAACCMLHAACRSSSSYFDELTAADNDLLKACGQVAEKEDWADDDADVPNENATASTRECSSVELCLETVHPVLMHHA